MKRRLLAIFLCFLAIVSTYAVAGRIELKQQLHDYLEASQETWNFRGAVLVARDGKVILASGYGFANEEFGEENTNDTKFMIGSITKQFTASAILRLQEKGLLKVQDPINQYLLDYPRFAGGKVTIHHLLTHTSGIPNYTEDPELLAKRTTPVSPSTLMKLVMSKPLEFEPGSKFSYSNSGYIILGAIIESVSGQSYEAFLHHEILKPSGMLNSGYARREAGLPHRADGYTVDNDRDMIAAPAISYSVLHTAGALYSTISDMLLWDKALTESTVLSSESVQAMFTDYGYEYGYGWFMDSLYGRSHLFHGGFLDGFNTTIDRWPDDKLLVIVFSNEDEVPIKKMARGLASICFFGRPYFFPSRKTSISTEPGCLAAYEGAYQPGLGDIHLIMLEDDTLHIYLPGRKQDRLLPEALDSFFLLSDNTIVINFNRDNKGQVVGYELWDEGITIQTLKLDSLRAYQQLRLYKAQAVTQLELRAVAGTYQLESQMLDSSQVFYLEIVLENKQLYASLVGFDRIELHPCSALEFFHRTIDFRLFFTTDNSGDVINCILEMGNASVLGHRIR
ncbi:MAG: serine hydrolase domain-containing protein [candidate division Zixibacteria bacterium]|nr:serine hydrolase domain-containing protein [candidate division Zixibacteria bacterium]